MSVQAFSSIRYRIREAIRDTYSLLWDDDGLDELINEAQREYSIYSGALTGEFSVTTNERNIYNAPVDFIEPIKIYDTKGIELGLFSWRYLNDLYPDFRKITGNFARGACFDFDGIGKYRVFPKLSSGVEVGKVIYRRLSHPDKIETRNTEAIEQHCLFQMFLLTGKGSASNYYNNFLKAVNLEVRSSHTLRNRKPIHLGRFY